MGEFFHKMAHSLAELGYVRLFFLEVDGARVAATLCFDYGNELSVYNSGYHPEYSHLSVGLLVKAFCIREAIAWGKERVDFLRGPETYKYHLGAQDQPVYRCLIGRAS